MHLVYIVWLYKLQRLEDIFFRGGKGDLGKGGKPRMMELDNGDKAQ